jgi:hypothetical protein
MTTITVRRSGGQSVEDIKWEPQELEVIEKPNGPAAAAIIASALGVFFLGLFTTLNEVSERLHDWLVFQNRVGPLSGKTTMAGVLWLVSWVALSVPLWRRNLPLVNVALVAAGLIVLGFIGTFPKFFELFAD